MELDIAGLAAQANPLVVVVDGDGEGALGGLLTDDVAVELIDDRARRRVLRPLRRLFFREDVVTQRHALVADEYARAAD